MKQQFDLQYYLDFFKKDLSENLLGFWMTRCIDQTNGGYLNCFSNDGSRLVSTDKYSWSQGRFLWLFSRLSMMRSDLFNKDDRCMFLAYAENGKDFLLKHVLLAPDDYRCVFLMDAAGNPKKIAGFEGYDLSISADCFVAMGFAAYARAAEDFEAWLFAKKLGESIWDRYQSGNYRSLPYPVPPAYQSHAKPMILTNLCCELYYAAVVFDPEWSEVLRCRIEQCHTEVFEVFQDEYGFIHEFKYTNGYFADNLFGQHINPGHMLEDMWFQLEASEIIDCSRYHQQIAISVKRAMQAGWDPEFGGLFHFVPCDGINTCYQLGDAADEPQMHLVLDDWDSKLWWAHSEAMYTTLLMHFRTGEDLFLEMFKAVFDYSYKTFPNPDSTIREWIQIRTRDGQPQNKVVALPVKDPYHIIRNVLMIIELLEREIEVG